MAAMIDTSIIYSRITTFRLNNPNYSNNYSFVCCRYRAFYGKPCRPIYTTPFQLQPRVPKLLEYFLKNNPNWKFTKIHANSSREHDTDSTDKTETSLPENPKKQGASSESGRREKQGKSNWWNNNSDSKWRWQPIIQVQDMGVLLIQLGIVMFVMRLLRPGIPRPGSEPRPPATFVSVPYSEFLSKINGNQVQKVEVDGVHIMFKLKRETESKESVAVSEMNSKFQDSDSLLRCAIPTKRIVYMTTRPTYIKAPYEKMLDNNVEFGSPDKRSGGFFNSAMIALFDVAVLAGILNRFPVSFTQNTPGQPRNRKTGNSGGATVSEQSDIITFADVAGVDEAKEELEGIAEFLRNPDRYVRLGGEGNGVDLGPFKWVDLVPYN